MKYPGVETKFLQYWNDGRKYSLDTGLYFILVLTTEPLGKKVIPNGIVDVDPDTVDNKKVNMKVLTDFGDDDLEVCCEGNNLL